MVSVSDDQYSDEETVRRRDEVVRRILNTPPQPRPTKPKDEKGEERPAEDRAHRPKARP